MDQVARDRAAVGEKWWQDWRWIVAVAGFFFSIGFCVFVFISIQTNREVVDQGPVVERLESLAEANRETLVQVQRSQEGIDTLVSFVDEIRAGARSQSTQDVMNLLCASSDPVRIEACRQLQEGDP